MVKVSPARRPVPTGSAVSCWKSITKEVSGPTSAGGVGESPGCQVIVRGMEFSSGLSWTPTIGKPASSAGSESLSWASRQSCSEQETEIVYVKSWPGSGVELSTVFLTPR